MLKPKLTVDKSKTINAGAPPKDRTTTSNTESNTSTDRAKTEDSTTKKDK